MYTNQKSSLEVLYDIIDQQIKAEKEKRPPGDRRRTNPFQAKPPEGMEERRAGIDRRGNNRLR
jgi:hypothetical protein